MYRIIPSVSVIMSVFNGQKHLAECIESILNQSFSDFEFIIVDDASKDDTPVILQEYADKDKRIKVLTNDVNRERIYSRNRAITHSTAPLIAVMDADDYAFPTRLEKQIQYMNRNPTVSVSGSSVMVYETNEIWSPPTTDSSIRSRLLFNSCLYHPTVIFRKEIILDIGGYQKMPSTEDYELWYRLLNRENVKYGNISDVLVRYRTSPEINRDSYKRKQREYASTLRKKMLKRLGVKTSFAEIAVHNAIANLEPAHSYRELRMANNWLRKLRNFNRKNNVYKRADFEFELSKRWNWYCVISSRNLLGAAFLYFSSPLVSIRFQMLLSIMKSFICNLLRKSKLYMSLLI